MAVLKMQKINLCAMKKNRKRILEAVQAMGVVEVSSWQDEMEGFQKMDTSHRAVRVPGDIFCVVHARDLAELRVASEQAPERDAVRHIRAIWQSRLAVIRLFLDDIRDARERRRHRLPNPWIPRQ